MCRLFLLSRWLSRHSSNPMPETGHRSAGLIAQLPLFSPPPLPPPDGFCSVVEDAEEVAAAPAGDFVVAGLAEAGVLRLFGADLLAAAFAEAAFLAAGAPLPLFPAAAFPAEVWVDADVAAAAVLLVEPDAFVREAGLDFGFGARFVAGLVAAGLAAGLAAAGLLAGADGLAGDAAAEASASAAAIGFELAQSARVSRARSAACCQASITWRLSASHAPDILPGSSSRTVSNQAVQSWRWESVQPCIMDWTCSL